MAEIREHQVGALNYCQHCIYFVAVVSNVGGECHRRAPEPGPKAASAVWPVVSAHDFCGDGYAWPAAEVGKLDAA